MASAMMTCPKCRSPLSGSAAVTTGLTCPVCKSRLPSRPSPRRRIVVGLVAGSVLVYLVVGIALAVYLVNRVRKPAVAGPAVVGSASSVATPVRSGAPSPARASSKPAEPTRQTDAPVPVLTEQEIEVQRAIDRGVQYLQQFVERHTTQPQLGLPHSREGILALVGFTLLECGVPAEDSGVREVADTLRAKARQLDRTYPLALAILFFDRLGEKRDEELIRTLALRLIVAQDPSGAWGYMCPIALTSQDEEQVSAYLSRFPETSWDPGKIKEAEQDLNDLPSKLRGVAVGPRQGRTGPFVSMPVDHSNTQFALLALWVAQRHGVPVQPSLALAADHFRKAQKADGSWGYHVDGQQWRSSMTCAGLLGLAVGRGVEGKISDGESRGKIRDPAIERGLRYLSQTIGQSRSGRRASGRSRPIGADANGDLYYLWSLERVAMVYDLPTIEGKDWYAWAADTLVGIQKSDGSWRDNFPEPVDTSFALLVLRRVNVAHDLTANIKRLINLKDVEGAREIP